MKDFDKKETWGPGPWQDEPDRLEWRYKGMPCLLRRSPVSGGWCGYVAVAPGHPWHGKHYGDDDFPDIDIHGTVTFSAGCTEHGEICHKPEPGEPDDVWWLGFDCGHSCDFAPRMDAQYRRLVPGFIPRHLGNPHNYRTIPYAKSEVEHLADQVENARKERT